ncbi:STM3941 family protein [Novosphingobium resinovorum]|uniref:STM3941 family protein n=1 Tax=Novosphingobium resinovorum TaxID=158500 RepID=UPI002ED5FFB9|nr:STM3941 family protein [Novosphingobium resinovorum]
MPDEFLAFPSRWRIALILLGSLGFVAIAAWMVGAFGTPPASDRYAPAVVAAIGWAGIAFFGLCAAVAVRRLFARGVELRIDGRGIHWTRWSDETIPWREITDVTVWRYRGQRTIILHLRNPSLYPGRGVLGMTARANRSLTGGDIGISLNAMDRSFDEAMAAIERLRD